MSRTSAAFTLMMPAAPRPCSVRAAISVPIEFDSTAASEDTVNSAMPSR